MLQGKEPGNMERSSPKDPVKFNPFANKFTAQFHNPERNDRESERNRLRNNRLTRSSSPSPTEIKSINFLFHPIPKSQNCDYYFTLLPRFRCIFLLDKTKQIHQERDSSDGHRRDALVESRHPPPPPHQFIVIGQNSLHNLCIASCGTFSLRERE